MEDEIIIIVTEDKVEDVFGDKRIYSLQSKPRKEIRAIAAVPTNNKKFYKLTAVTLSCHDEVLRNIHDKNEIIFSGNDLKKLSFLYYDSINLFI